MKIIILIVTVTLFLFSGCSDDKSSDKIFYFNEPNNIESLDPITANNYPAINVLINTCEGLVEYNKDAQLQPLIVKTYEISPDGMLYTFHLRADVFFHDNPCFPNGKGRKVIASDFKYCFERVCNTELKTRGLWVYRDKVEGADEYSKAPGKVNEIKGFIAVNDSTFQIKLIQPFAPFLSILTMPYGYVYPKEYIDYYKENAGFNIVGTGPFKFVKWDYDKELVFTKNENYRIKDIPKIDGFQVSFLRSQEAEYLDFTGGKLDFQKPPADIFSQIVNENGELKPEYDFELIRQPYLNTVYLCTMLNPEMEGGKSNVLADNVKLRQAINYAIDREKIIKYVLKGKGTPGVHGFLPRGMPGFSEDVKSFAYDKQKAIQLLEESGYPGGRGLTLKLVYYNDESQRELCEALQAQFKEIGIDMQIEEMLGASHRSAQNEGKLTYWRANWGADYYDPENYYALLYSKNETPIGPNTSHYRNLKVDSLYELGLKLTDLNERMKAYKEIEKIFLEDSPFMVVYYNQFIYLKQKRISGMYVDGLGIINLKYTEIK